MHLSRCGVMRIARLDMALRVCYIISMKRHTARSERRKSMNLSDIVVDAISQVFNLDTTPNPTNESSYMALRIFTFGKLCGILQEIGWQEHTSDWDPYIEIQMKDGTTQETMSGYYSLTLEGMSDDTTLCVDADKITHVLFESADDDSDHETILRVAIADIEKLVLAT